MTFLGLIRELECAGQIRPQIWRGRFTKSEICLGGAEANLEEYLKGNYKELLET